MTLINQIEAASGPDDLVRAFAYVLEAAAQAPTTHEGIE